MSLPNLFELQQPEPQPDPCAVCGQPSEWVVWHNRVCVPCGSAWMAEPIFQGRKLDGATLEETCANFTRETAKWVAARRAKR